MCPCATEMRRMKNDCWLGKRRLQLSYVHSTGWSRRQNMVSCRYELFCYAAPPIGQHEWPHQDFSIFLNLIFWVLNCSFQQEKNILHAVCVCVYAPLNVPISKQTAATITQKPSGHHANGFRASNEQYVQCTYEKLVTTCFLSNSFLFCHRHHNIS